MSGESEDSDMVVVPSGGGRTTPPQSSPAISADEVVVSESGASPTAESGAGAGPAAATKADPEPEPAPEPAPAPTAVESAPEPVAAPAVTEPEPEPAAPAPKSSAPQTAATASAAATATATATEPPGGAATDSKSTPATATATATAAVEAVPTTKGDEKSTPAAATATATATAGAATATATATAAAAAASKPPAPKEKEPDSLDTADSNAPAFAPLSVPLHRRRQTFTVLIWLLTPLVCALTALYLIRAESWLFYLFLGYVMWMVFGQTYHKNGGHPQPWFKRLVWWKWMADYFPIRLHKTADIAPDKSYIFGYHPHGIISLGAFVNFATNGTGFEQKYPGINLRLLTLTANFRIPFYGFYLTALGICDASPESCNAILKRGAGNSLLLVLGGAKESLDAHPGTADLTLKDRKGFVKIGLMTGASLVPVFGFGETDLYDQVDNPQGSKLRKLQEILQAKLGFALPLVKGRGVFNYRAGLLPHRRAIDAVVGTPLDLPKLSRDQITPEILDKYHGLYLDALKKLYDDHKNTYAPKRRKSMSFVR